MRACPGCGKRVSHMSKSGVCSDCFEEVRSNLGSFPSPDAILAAVMARRLERDRSTPFDYSQCVRVTGNAVVFSDTHIPFHDHAWLGRMLATAKRKNIRKAVGGGDLIDFHEITYYPKSKRGLRVQDSLHLVCNVLEEMARVFTDGIWCIKGNHELRLERLIHDATMGRSKQQDLLADLKREDVADTPFRQQYVEVLEQWMHKNAPEAAKVVHWQPEAFIEIDGPEGLPPWRLIHQGNGSRNATIEATHHAMRHHQPIIMTHTHLVGQRIDASGKYPCVNIGMTTREEWQEYAWREPKGYPVWTRSYATIIGGKMRLYIDNPYLEAA